MIGILSFPRLLLGTSLIGGWLARTLVSSVLSVVKVEEQAPREGVW
jgi:hypothetical protein